MHAPNKSDPEYRERCHQAFLRSPTKEVRERITEMVRWLGPEEALGMVEFLRRRMWERAKRRAEDRGESFTPLDQYEL